MFQWLKTSRMVKSFSHRSSHWENFQDQIKHLHAKRVKNLHRLNIISLQVKNYSLDLSDFWFLAIYLFFICLSALKYKTRRQNDSASEIIFSRHSEAQTTRKGFSSKKESLDIFLFAILSDWDVWEVTKVFWKCLKFGYLSLMSLKFWMKKSQSESYLWQMLNESWKSDLHQKE